MNFKKILLFVLLISLQINSQNLTGVKICINPGHGGFDSDDRNVVIAPYTSGNQNGFWESQSNLDKGQQLRTMLQNAGASVIITRTTNTTSDDLPLSQIVAMANQNNSDFMLSIHSNAGSGVANHVLQIHYGSDLSDKTVYNTYNPNNAAQLALSNRSREISTIIAQNQYSNQLNTWSSGYNVSGDKTFARLYMGFSDGYGVLRGLTVPGVISEGSMHDYIPETYRLMNMEYKWLEAWQFYKSFCTYYNGGTIPTGNIAGMVRDSRLKIESTYNKFKGKDEMLPLNGAEVTLIETGAKYTVDQMQNGVYVFKNLTPGTYHVKAVKAGYYDITQEVTVTANNTSYSQFGLNRIRLTPPQVVSFSPNVAITDSVEASTSIVISFNWDMDIPSTEQAFTISPAVAGKFTWEDTNYRMRFTPDKPFDKATVYTIKLAKTASHPDNLSMTEDFTFQFLTKNRNRLTLLASYPFNQNNGVYTSPGFRLIFDKVLNTANLQASIKVLDKNNLELIKNTRTILNNKVIAPYGSHYFELAAALTPNEEYTLQIPANIIDEVGMAVVEPINIKFKASAVAVSTQPIVETFETVALTYVPSESTEISSASVTNHTVKLFGSYSNKLNVSYSGSDSEALFGLLKPLDVESGKVIGLHIYGDLSGNEIWLQFRIPGGVQYQKLCDLNFFGWEYREVKTNVFQPLMTTSLTGIKIVRKSGVLSASNEIFLDNMLLYNTPILSVNKLHEGMIKIYPNPVSDKLTVKVKDVENPLLQLYSINGMLMKEISGNELNVSNINTGTYILKVKFDKASLSFPVIIVR